MAEINMGMTPPHEKKHFTPIEGIDYKSGDEEGKARVEQKLAQANIKSETHVVDVVEKEKSLVEQAEAQIAEFELNLKALNYLSENYAKQTDERLKELLGEELLRTKENVYEKTNGYILGLNDEGSLELKRSKKKMIEIRNSMFEVGAPDGKFDIAV